MQTRPKTKSLSYHDFLISRLKEDPEEAAGYLTAITEEKDPEPELLKHALQDVAEALGETRMPAAQAKEHLEKLDRLLSVEGSREIYNLSLWLEELGLKLSVTTNSDNGR